MSVLITLGLPGWRSGYDHTNPLPPTRKSKPSLSISSTCGSASARRRTSSSSATGESQHHAHRVDIRTDSAPAESRSERHGHEHGRARVTGSARWLKDETEAVAWPQPAREQRASHPVARGTRKHARRPVAARSHQPQLVTL